MHQSLITVKIRPFIAFEKPAHSAARSRNVRQVRREGRELRNLRRDRLAMISGVR